MPTAPPATTPVAERVAAKVLRETLRVKRGENVIIETWSHTLEHARAFELESRRIGAHPVVLFQDEANFWRSVEECDPKVLGEVGAHEWALLSKAHAYVFLWGPADRARLQALDPKVRAKLLAYNEEWYDRAKRARLRAARMEIGRATEEMSRQLNAPLGAWQRELVEASLVDTAPMVKEGKRVGGALARGKVLVVDHPNGTHLELRLRGLRPRIEDGVVGPEDVAAGSNVTSIPSGWVAAALDERFAQGTFRSNRTSYLPQHRADGGEWTLANGHLVSHTYRSGGDAFEGPFAKAPKKGRDQVGMVSIGLNPKITSAPLLEDQERGTVCLTLGRNDELGGRNRVPFMTWLVLGGADVAVDGRPLVRSGNIV